MSGLILVPTYNRPERLKKMIGSFMNSGAGCDGVILVGCGDPAEDGYIELGESLPENWTTVWTPDHSMGDKVRYDLKSIPTLPDHITWLGLANDDHIFKGPPQWDKRIDALIDGSSFISTDDGWHDPFKHQIPAGITCWSVDLIKAVGYIFPEGLHHMFIDNIWADLGNATDCWLVDTTTVVAHEHASRKDEWKDETHKKSESYYLSDMERYKQWRKGGEFDSACKAILELKRLKSSKTQKSQP